VKYNLTVTSVTIFLTVLFNASVSTGSTSVFSDSLAPISENGFSLTYTVVITDAYSAVSRAGK
jgi:hypothetical protein